MLEFTAEQGESLALKKFRKTVRVNRVKYFSICQKRFQLDITSTFFVIVWRNNLKATDSENKFRAPIMVFFLLLNSIKLNRMKN